MSLASDLTIIIRTKGTKQPQSCRHCDHKFRLNQRILSKRGKYYCIPCANLVHIIDDEEEKRLRNRLAKSLRQRRQYYDTLMGLGQ